MNIPHIPHLIGNTIRLETEFYDLDDVLVDPPIIKIKFYDRLNNLIEQESVGSGNKISTGKYFYDYTIESQATTYEWYAELEGMPSLERKTLRPIFKRKS